MAKFLHWFAAPNTTLLLYQGLGPAILGHQRRPTIGGVNLIYQAAGKNNSKLNKRLMGSFKVVLDDLWLKGKNNSNLNKTDGLIQSGVR